MSVPNIGAMGGGAAQQGVDPAAIIGQNVSGAVGGVANRLGVDPQQLGAVVTGMMDAAANGDQAKLGDAMGALVQVVSQAAQAQARNAGSCEAAPASAGGGAPASAGGPSSLGAGASQAAGGGNPLDMLIQLLAALGVPRQLIEQIVNAVARNAQGQSEGQSGGGVAAAGPAVPGVQAA